MTAPTPQPTPGTPIGQTAAPTAWIPTTVFLAPDDPANPNRTLLLDANSSVPQLVANALNSGDTPARAYALTNLLEAADGGDATAAHGMGRLFDSTYPDFASPAFTALLTSDARGALGSAIIKAGIGGATGITALLNKMHLVDGQVPAPTVTMPYVPFAPIGPRTQIVSVVLDPPYGISAPATVTIRHSENLIQIVGHDLHTAIAKAVTLAMRLANT